MRSRFAIYSVVFLRLSHFPLETYVRFPDSNATRTRLFIRKWPNRHTARRRVVRSNGGRCKLGPDPFVTCEWRPSGSSSASDEVPKSFSRRGRFVSVTRRFLVRGLDRKKSWLAVREKSKSFENDQWKWRMELFLKFKRAQKVRPPCGRILAFRVIRGRPGVDPEPCLGGSS